MKWIFTIFFSFLFYSLQAQIATVSRAANLRSNASGKSEILEKLKIGDTLLLVNPNKKAGYYQVSSLNSGLQGWVYASLIKHATIKINQDISDKNLAQDAGLVDIRVIDVGQGLCIVIKLPGNKYVIYDAGGDNSSKSHTLEQIRKSIAGTTVDLMVLSHMDADHIAAADEVIDAFKVKKLLWGGYEKSMTGEPKPTQAYNQVVHAISRHPEMENVNLNVLDSTITPGNSFVLGGATFTFLCGFGKPLPEWQLDRSEKLNSVSIVMKVEYGGNSVLICGDAVGRHREETEVNAIIATEAFMVKKASKYLPSTVLVAPHHGANNGSSRTFVNMVKPKSVIFSAGSGYRHPTTRTANEYLRVVAISSIFRTDLGDYEGGEEWALGTKGSLTKPYKDIYGDDNVQIQLRANGTYRVFYVK
ncbi:MAG: MBL fold metallo-hydrolase [Bacteroidota bacterium]